MKFKQQTTSSTLRDATSAWCEKLVPKIKVCITEMTNELLLSHSFFSSTKRINSGDKQWCLRFIPVNPNCQAWRLVPFQELPAELWLRDKAVR